MGEIESRYMKRTIIRLHEAAVPLYCRSADNIRDHRNVTSMLHRIITVKNGVTINRSYL